MRKKWCAWQVFPWLEGLSAELGVGSGLSGSAPDRVPVLKDICSKRHILVPCLFV